MTETWKECEGQVVDGKFHLRQYLGGSDHSAVFLTELDQRGPRQAVIKFIPADPETSEIQITQWQLAAKLFHPQLIQLFQMGRCHLGGRDLLFVVMEYAEENLAQILPHRPLSPAEARDMLPPVLDALTYIHGHGLVHGRLRPSNIMAIGDQLKISRDGLYEAGQPEKGWQEPKSYNAPEAATGLTPASDVWSLGMTLVEVLTQRPLLWEGSVPGEPVIPETVPPPFRNIASHCLRRDPQLRWTIPEIAASLQQPLYDSRKQAAADPSSFSSHSGSGRPLTRSRLVGPIVAAVVLLAVLAGGSRLLRHHRESRQDSSPATTTVVPSSPASPAQEVTEPETTKPAPTHDYAQSDSATFSSAPIRSDRTAKPSRPGSASGSVIQQALPEVSRSARDTIQGRVKVKVRVNVDPTGSVVEAKFESPGPSKYFANKSLEAARHWKFAAPQVGGQAVDSEWVLRFAIGRSSTTVQPTETKP
jgi:TonB family protein